MFYLNILISILSISSGILSRFQPINNYILSQDVTRYLTISSAILNYQPIGNYQPLAWVLE